MDKLAPMPLKVVFKAAQPADLEEERRLFYVALTRAKDRLHLFAVKERYHRKQEPSRFLKECLE